MLSDELTFVVRVVPVNTDALHDVLCLNRYHTPGYYRPTQPDTESTGVLKRVRCLVIPRASLI